MELVILKDRHPFTTSLIISENIGIEHRAVISLIKKYQSRKILSSIKAFEMTKLNEVGRHTEVAYLNENQALFVITLMKNSDKVLDFKEALVNAFIEKRNLLQHLMAQRKDVDWVGVREQTKVIRKECTDVIQRFINYAKEQGSKSAEKYYMNFSRMELTGLFLMEQKYPNARDVMSIRQLHLIEMADEAIAISLSESMRDNIPYKECYQIAKERICMLARIFPPSPLPLLLESK